MAIETWIIVNKKTGEQWKAHSGKSSWSRSSHAKAAWANSEVGWCDNPKIYFDDQTEYILKEIDFATYTHLEAKIQKMEAMIKSEEWQQLKEFVHEA